MTGLALAVLLVHAASSAEEAGIARVPVVGGPCEGCEWVFEGIPAEIPSAARIAPAGEPGEPLRIEGTVTWPDGSPAAGTIVYAYHTDIEGVYPRGVTRHGALRGWARADENGRYRFDTVRPAGYPGTDIPQHVHMHVIEPGRCTYVIGDVLFRDDPRLTPEQIRFHDRGKGGPGVATPRREADGMWVAARDIKLGEGVRDWPQAPRGDPAPAAGEP